MGRDWDGADGFRRSLNPADAGRDSVFGRTSRTSPEYRTGKPSSARIRTRVDQRTNPKEGKSTTSTPEAYVAGPLYQQWCKAWAAECLRVLKPGGFMLAFGGCYDAQTEVLTARGWVSMPDVTMADSFASLDPDTHEVEFVKPVEIVHQPHDGPMHHYRTNRVDLLVTPNHKMFVSGLGRGEKFRLRRSDEVPAACRMTKTSIGRADAVEAPFVVRGATIGTSHGHTRNVPAVTVPAETWAAFLGLWMAEGHASITPAGRGGYSTHVALTHFDETNMAEMEAMLKPYFPHVRRYPASGRLRINDRRLYNYFEQFGHAPDKWLPDWLKTQPPHVLRVFLDWYARGDGDRDGRVYTASRRLADDVQEVAMYAGWAADIAVRPARRGGVIGGRAITPRHPQHVVRILRAQTKPEVYGRRKAAPTRAVVPAEEWAGRWVYCVELRRHHTLYVRRNGKAVWCGNTRTYHRLTCAIEDAGFEVRDCILWVYGSGFPKSLDVSKAIDKVAGRVSTSVEVLKRALRERYEASGKTLAQIDAECGFRAANYLSVPAEGKRPDPWFNVLPSAEKWAVIKRVLGVADDAQLDAWFAEAEREVLGRRPVARGVAFSSEGPTEVDVTAPATDAAKRWDGWGTALKPSHEPIVVARKPLAGTVASNVTTYGTGALNIDATRVATEDDLNGGAYSAAAGARWDGTENWRFKRGEAGEYRQPSGRWPTNLVFSHSADCTEKCAHDCPVAELDRQSGTLTTGTGAVKRATGKGGPRSASIGAESRPEGTPMVSYGDSGGASRFFPVFRYEAKADSSERPRVDGVSHPTVKPVGLMRWLVRLVTPSGGLVLDPFAGSGTTAEACVVEGFRCIAIEREPTYLPLIVARLTKPLQPTLGLDQLAGVTG